MSENNRCEYFRCAKHGQVVLSLALLLFSIYPYRTAEFAIAGESGQYNPNEDQRDVTPEIPQVEIQFIDGVAGILTEGNSGRRQFNTRLPSSVKGTTCGQGDDCSLRASEDVVLSLNIPTSGYWSFSLCGSGFDTYLAVGSAPCTEDIGSNDDFCGTSSLAGCLWVQSGTVYVTIEAGSNTCGTYKFAVTPCVPGRCCYMDTENTAACLNTTVEECAAVGGEWDRQATCENDPCEVGRCCYREDGISYCTENTLHKPCLFNLDGVWTEDATCDQPCEFGADSSLCGPIDLVIAIDVSGSMNNVLANVSAEAEDILLHAAQVSGADLRASLVTFREFVEVRSPLSDDIEAVAATFGNLIADGGANPGEASDEALREIITQDGECVQGGRFDVGFRNHAVKIVIIITDELNSACTHIYDPAYAHQRALDAAAAGIHISSVYLSNGANHPEISSVLQDYAATSGGLYVVSESGTGVANEINGIIALCGSLGLKIVGDSIPEVICTETEAIPAQVNFNVLVRNFSDQSALSGVVIVGAGSGPGGTGVVVSDNPMGTGEVAPQDTVAIPYTVSIDPNVAGGCISFPVFLMSGDDTLSSRTICIDIPPIGATLSAHTVPQIGCDGDSLSPTTFEVTVTVHNLSTCVVSNALVRLSNGSGTGGTGTVLSASPVSAGEIPGNGDAIVPFTVTIFPQMAGGLITFVARLILDGDTVAARNISVNVPQRGIVFTRHTVPQALCVSDTLPTTFEVSVTVRNPSGCEINNAQVFMCNGTGGAGPGIILSQNPVQLGALSAGDSAIVPFTAQINTHAVGGPLMFRARLVQAGDTVGTRNLSMTVPPIGAQLSAHTVPQLTCADDSLLSSVFDVSVSVQNTSSCEISGAQVCLSNGTGSGGTGVVLTAGPQLVEALSPNEVAQVPFTVSIDPHGAGGVIVFRASLVFEHDTLTTRNVSVTVPACGCDSVEVVTVTVGPSYLDECFCVALCDTNPIPFRIYFTGSAPGLPPIPYASGQCGEGCVAGSAAIQSSTWLRVGNHWENSVQMVNPGCVRFCFDFILPAELESFDAVPQYGGINLVWRTQSETELDEFELLRNGVLMEIVQARNSPLGAEYEWLDVAVTTGRAYEYQLIAVDMSGTRTTLATTSATPLNQPTVVSEYALLPNYPNPFNGSTSIAFELPVSAEVTLIVYDVNGREVAELARGRFSAGRHHVTFGGEGLASGLYLCHMTAPGFSTRQKMLLLK